MIKKLSFYFPILFLLSCSQEKETVDLILHHGKIYSVDSAFSIHSTIAIKDGKIYDIGDTSLLQKYHTKKIVDLFKKPVYPGFIDAHCHFLGYGLGLGNVDLVGTKSYKECVDRVVNSARNLKEIDGKTPEIKNGNNAGDWIIGRGWDQNDWENKQMPDNKKLNELFPDRPVFLVRIDGHAALANDVALKLAGIDENTSVSGGEIIKKGKRLTGVLIDNAVDLVKNKIPQPDPQEMAEALLNAQSNCVAMGITTVDDAGLMYNEINLIDQLQQQGFLKMRVYAMLSDTAPNYDVFLKKGPYNTDRLNVRAFKFYADGALGSRGACLLENYEDKNDWKGFLLSEREHFEQKAAEIIKHGFQMNTHCIGDSAYKVILNAYKKAGAKKENRWRIEHAQVVNPREVKESDGIIPSVQPTHATSDMYWAAERLGKERVKNAYAYKDLLNASGMVALGTDFPVEDISPFKTFYAAVARQDSEGFPEGGFQKENALSREETLRGMTIWAAYSNFEEQLKGSLEKGKLADFVILDRDLMVIPEEELLKVKVLATYIHGEKVFVRKNDF